MEKKFPWGIFFAILGLIILVLTIVLTSFLVQRRTYVSSRAYGSPEVSTQEVQLENSYMFASPLRAKAGEKIRITVFLLDGRGRGVQGKTVSLGQATQSLTIEPVQPVTDDLGGAIFDVSSSRAALYTIEAKVEGKLLPQRVNVKFE